MKRTFLAIKINPTKELLSRIDFFKQHLAHENINWIKKSQFHITLRFIGDTPDHLIEAIGNDFVEEFSNSSAFQLKLEGISLFGSKHQPRVIWVGAQPFELLQNMAATVDKSLSKLGFKRDRQNYVPHLTLARIRKLNDKRHFHRVMDSSDKGFIQSEVINSVIFYESILEKTGVVYHTLKEIDLRG